MTEPGWICYACGGRFSSETSHTCRPPNTETWLLYPEPRFEKCPACGLEWRGVVKNCPYCSLTFAGYNKVQAERDQARDWCRMLVALVRAYHDGYCFLAWTDAQRCEALYEALPPELRAAIEE